MGRLCEPSTHCHRCRAECVIGVSLYAFLASPTCHLSTGANGEWEYSISNLSLLWHKKDLVSTSLHCRRPEIWRERMNDWVVVLTWHPEVNSSSLRWWDYCGPHQCVHRVFTASLRIQGRASCIQFLRAGVDSMAPRRVRFVMEIPAGDRVLMLQSCKRHTSKSGFCAVARKVQSPIQTP